MDNKMNLTLLADFYEITMANGYLEHGVADQIAYYDVFFRKIPDEGGFAIMAGLEQVIEYLKNLHLQKKILPICAGNSVLTRHFWSIWNSFNFAVMCGRFRKGCLFFRANR